MDLEKRKKATLGVFVILGVLILIAAIYYMGNSQGLFGSRIQVTTTFNNVQGLQAGNNVRFSGIKVGVVKSVSLASDSSVQALMNIDEGASKYIKQDSYASIGTDGLMGNKIIEISSGSPQAASIDDGDNLPSQQPVGMNDIMGKVNTTAEEASLLIKNLNDISRRIKAGKGPLGKLLSDSTMAESIDRTLALIQTTGQNAKNITEEINQVTTQLNKGEGLANRMIYDESWPKDIQATLDSLRQTGNTIHQASEELKQFSEALNQDDNNLKMLLSDTTLVKNLKETLKNIEKGTRDLDDAVNTVEESWILNLFSGDN